MPVRAFIIPVNPSSRYFIRFGIWLSALIRCSNGHRVNNWHKEDNEKSSARLYPLAITLPLSALIPLCLKHCIVFTCAGFHLLMIQAVFSASGDNVLSALWEISVFWRDSLDLFGMSLLLSRSLFLSLLSFQNFSSALSFSFIPHFSYSPHYSLPFTLSFSISPVSHFFFEASQRRVRIPISLLHTLLTFRLSPPSRLHAYQHQVNSPLSLIFIHTASFFLLNCLSLLWMFFCLAVPLWVYTRHFNIPSYILALPLNALSLLPALLLHFLPPSSDVTFSLVFCKPFPSGW